MFRPLVAAVVAAVLIAASPSSAAPDVFTIPVIVPMTGAGAEYGAGDKIGIQLAVDEINAKGGVNGHKLDVKLLDDASQPTQAATIMHGLVGDNLVVLGPNLSGTCKAAFPVANTAGVPTVTGSNSDATIIADNRPWTFNVFPVTQQLSKLAATHWQKATKAKTIVAIVDKDNAATIVQANALLDALQANGTKLLRRIDVSESQATYNSEADAAKSLNPDALLISAYPDAAGAITKAVRGAGITQPILFTTTTVTPDSMRIAGPAMTNGYVMMSTWPHVGPPKKLAFDDAFEKASGGVAPAPTSAFLYDTVYVIAAALKSSGVLDSTKALPDRRAALRDALGHTHIDGATGNFTLSPDGLRSASGIWMQVTNGKIAVAPN